MIFVHKFLVYSILPAYNISNSKKKMFLESM